MVLQDNLKFVVANFHVALTKLAVKKTSTKTITSRYFQPAFHPSLFLIAAPVIFNYFEGVFSLK